MDIKGRCESLAIMADVDDEREPNARLTGHMSVICIISLPKYQALNMDAPLLHLLSFPSSNSSRSRGARRRESFSVSLVSLVLVLNCCCARLELLHAKFNTLGVSVCVVCA